MSGSEYGWPVFQNQNELTNSPWSKYFQLVYGEIPTTGYPICIGNLMLIYADQAAQSQVSLPPLMDSCPKQSGDYHKVLGWKETGFTWIYNTVLSEPYSDNKATGALPPHIWVEIMHMGYKQDGEASWMYYTPGSAIWMYLGVTKTYKDHSDASQDLLGRPCKVKKGDLPNECELDFPLWYRAAIKRGMDTFQFLYHADASCGSGSGNLAIEVVDIHGPGRHSCSGFGGITRFRAGWEAKHRCTCDDSKDVINCQGFGMWR